MDKMTRTLGVVFLLLDELLGKVLVILDHLGKFLERYGWEPK